MATSKLNSVFSDLISSLVPANGRINSYLSLILNDRKVVSLTTRTLKTLLALWIVSRVNHALNMWARNHWCFRKPGQPWDFSGDKEIAVVTGGSSGFGLLIAKGLSRHCRVAVLDVQSPPEDLQSCTPYHPKWNSWDTLADTVVLGSNITFYHCDLASASAIHETADAIRRDIGDPSILVNNAGMARYNKLIEEEDDYVEKIFKVNIISHFILIKEFLPIMLKQEKGHIVSIASVGSYISGPPVVDYCATKASVLALHEGLKGELRKLYKPNGKCIQTTIVHPAMHATGMLKPLQASIKEKGGHVFPASNVSNAVIDQILKGQGNQIFEPANSVVISFTRVLPAWLQELLRDRQ